MNAESHSEPAVLDILWESLEGGDYNLDRLHKEVGRDTPFEGFLDSLDITDFVLRLEHHYKINIAQEDFPKLSSVAAVEDYVRAHSPVLSPT